MKNRGFTLMEVVIVLAIISVLSALMLAALADTRTRARDSLRVSNIKEIGAALFLYAENNGSAFPLSATPTTLTGTDAVSTALVNDNVIPQVPSDPQHPIYTYTYQATTTAYFTLSFCLETDTISNYTQGCGNTFSP